MKPFCKTTKEGLSITVAPSPKRIVPHPTELCMLDRVTMNDGVRFVVVKKTDAGVVLKPIGKVRFSKATMTAL
jgi:hypothetical protein